MSNNLQRVPKADQYRLMAVEMDDGRWYGQTSGELSLRDDIAAYRKPGCRPVYAVFVRPRYRPLTHRNLRD